MIPIKTYNGRNVALFGLGGSGLITARALLAGGADVVAFDDNPSSVDKAVQAEIPTADLRSVDWSNIDALVLAPGVPLTHPQPHWSVELAYKNNVEVIGDVELFSRELEALGRRSALVAITGTNGKSTTTALVAHVLSHAGRNVQMGGNIGRAVLDLDPISGEPEEVANQIYVVECSSYQIDLAPTLNPHVGVLLNLTPDHLERHGTMDNYCSIKERLVGNSDLAVIGVDDTYCLEIAQRLEDAGTPHDRISGHSSSGVDIGFGGQFLIDGDDEKLLRLDGIGALRGNHNAQNAAAACAACRALGLSYEEILTGLQSFPGLAHRMEQVGHVHGVLFVNDSKATNAEATAPALTSFPKVHWIAGGLAKDGGIESLQPHFSHVEKAYFIGEAAGSFASQLNDTIPYEIAGTLQQAVNHAALDAAGLVSTVQVKGREAPVVLLSPAAASFDQFPNFEKRGDAFKAAVSKLDGFRKIEV